MKTLVLSFLATILLAIPTVPLLTPTSQLVAFRSGPETYMDGPVPYHPYGGGRAPVPSTPQKPGMLVG